MFNSKKAWGFVISLLRGVHGCFHPLHTSFPILLGGSEDTAPGVSHIKPSLKWI
jgi:hypothetical protein